MKHQRIARPKAVGPRGFTKWMQPNPKHYIMVCCDCGLTHEFQFRVVGIRKQQAQFRARRAAGYTARERKRKHTNKRTKP